MSDLSDRNGRASPLRGMATVSFWADDHPAAVAWYTDLLGIEPYYVREGGYAEFRIGDLEAELGIIDSSWAPGGARPGPGGAVLLWAVDDIDATFADLLARGAVVYEPLIDRGEGFRTASVVDPFGNILGIMRNPHYLEQVSRLG